MNRIFVGLVGLTATIASTPLLASADHELVTVRRSVSLSGIDLATPDGQARARRHIAWAAVAVCEPSLADDLGRRLEVDRCRKVARQDALRQLDTQIARANARTDIMVASIAP